MATQGEQSLSSQPAPGLFQYILQCINTILRCIYYVLYIFPEYYFNSYSIYSDGYTPGALLQHVYHILRCAMSSSLPCIAQCCESQVYFQYNILFTLLLCTMHYCSSVCTMHYAVYLHCFVDFEYNAAFLSVLTSSSHNERIQRQILCNSDFMFGNIQSESSCGKCMALKKYLLDHQSS